MIPKNPVFGCTFDPLGNTPSLCCNISMTPSVWLSSLYVHTTHYICLIFHEIILNGRISWEPSFRISWRRASKISSASPPPADYWSSPIFHDPFSLVVQSTHYMCLIFLGIINALIVTNIDNTEKKSGAVFSLNNHV